MSDSRGLLEPLCFFSSIRVHKLEQLLNSKLEYEYRGKNAYGVIMKLFFLFLSILAQFQCLILTLKWKKLWDRKSVFKISTKRHRILPKQTS